jgi:hypothetical protein
VVPWFLRDPAGFALVSDTLTRGAPCSPPIEDIVMLKSAEDSRSHSKMKRKVYEREFGPNPLHHTLGLNT